MCGLLGAVTCREVPEPKLRLAMYSQRHRGPDADGIFSASIANRYVTLAHQRLAVIDLSPAGAQPMAHPETGSVLVFNGEIYNYLELRRRLESEGQHFSGHSDTEVLLHALEAWGLEAALSELNGMWAFAWLDRRNNRLHLSRDRCGEKPLYWTTNEQGLYFASELKSLLQLTGHRFLPNVQVIGEYLEQSLSGAGTETFFAGIQQLGAGTWMTVDLRTAECLHQQSSYWDCATNGQQSLPWPEFIDKLRADFFDSVRIRLRSDVPVGLLLSGGLDSSSIAAAIQQVGNGDCQLLSSVSADPRFDESPFIDRVSTHFDWPVTKVCLPMQPSELLPLLEKATWHADAPLASLSNVAHYMLMEQARELGLTVVLSGQGADELLCGYRKFLGFRVQELVRQRRFVQAGRLLADFLKNGTVISQFSLSEAKRYLPSALQGTSENLMGPAMSSFVPRALGMMRGMSLNERQRLDLRQFSVPALNHFEDRMSMAWSREIRLPFLDPRMIESLIAAPTHYKLDAGWTKYALRRAMEPYLPPEIVWRKDKQGFTNPQSEWLKRELRSAIMERYFCEEALIFKHGFVDRAALLRHYERFCRQKTGQGRIWFREIFNPLALEVWLRQFSTHMEATI